MITDILAFGAHPDDVELSAAATILKQISLGNTVAIIDLTRGELGTRGTAEIRDKEAAEAGKILGVSARENLNFRDGFFQNDEAHLLKVIEIIRKYRPKIVLANAPHDRHPDHGRAAKLVIDACFYSGLRRIETYQDGKPQEAWRPTSLYHYIQFVELKPDFIVDVSGFVQKKVEAMMAYSSQFYDPSSSEPETVISSKQFMESVTQRAANWGRLIGVEHGEGFILSRDLGIKNLFDLV